ncbi:hypothetical protein L2E82_24937 [Cichorium intybus]|uniref:Uncharacterized protein n=1 Tax=Cichorium intybus TaxID=13427 RepID=A0ACB9E299_CICIN|nr:hypothetical protein L2E82_24937 [Cichorium intybus]
MERLTCLNCKEWLRNWRRVLVIAGKLHLIEYPIPVPPEQVIIKSSYDKQNFLVDESEEIRDLMLLTIDPEFCKDFESLGPYELMQSAEEKFQKPVEEERARIFKRLAECKLKEGSSIDSHVLQIEAYIGELYKLGYSMSQESSVNTLLASLTSKHSSNGSATSGLSPVKRRSKKRSRSSGHVLNWESTKLDTVAKRLEDAPRSKSFESSAHVARNESPKDPKDRILESADLEEDDGALVEAVRSSMYEIHCQLVSDTLNTKPVRPYSNHILRLSSYPAVPGKERALLERTHVLRKQWELGQS